MERQGPALAQQCMHLRRISPRDEQHDNSHYRRNGQAAQRATAEVLGERWFASLDGEVDGGEVGEQRQRQQTDAESEWRVPGKEEEDRKSTRLNSSHGYISYA